MSRRRPPATLADTVAAIACRAGLVATVVVGTALLRDSTRAGRLDTAGVWDERSARSLFDALGDAGRAAYVRFYERPLGDMLFPACYAAWLGGALWRACPPNRRLLAATPLVAAACDFVENVSVLALLGAYPAWDGSHARLALRFGPFASAGKWMCLAATAMLLLWLGARMHAKQKMGKQD